MKTSEDLVTTPQSQNRALRGPRLIGRSGDRLIEKSLQNTCQIFRAVFREIFDESAYERFLTRTKATQSVESYQAFLREREAAIARKPRCC